MINQNIIRSISNKQNRKTLSKILFSIKTNPKLLLEISDKNAQFGEYFNCMYSMIQMEEEQKLSLVSNLQINSIENINTYGDELNQIEQMSDAFHYAIRENNSFSMLPIYSRITK